MSIIGRKLFGGNRIREKISKERGDFRGGSGASGSLITDELKEESQKRYGTDTVIYDDEMIISKLTLGLSLIACFVVGILIGIII